MKIYVTFVMCVASRVMIWRGARMGYTSLKIFSMGVDCWQRGHKSVEFQVSGIHFLVEVVGEVEVV
jgi:hypothetical protein